jgi:hypothetical protein
MKTLLLSLLLVSVLPGWAQEEQKAKKASRTCRIVFPERPKNAPKVAYLFDGKMSRQVTLPSVNFSEVITLPTGEITILMTPNEVTDPENPPTSAPSLKIAEGIQDFYIHVTTDPANPMLPLQLNLVDVGNGKLGPGETLWINLTDHAIEAKLEGSKMTAPPKGQTVSKAPLPSSGYYTAEFTYQPHAKGDFQRIAEQHWWHDAASRHLGFIVNTGGRLPRIYFYRDFR